MGDAIEVNLKMLLAGWLALVVAVGAQEIRRTPPNLPLQFGPQVIGQPVSAVRVLDFEPSASNAGAEAVHGEEVFARDSEGRTRSEIYYGSGETAVTILDPVAHTELRWVAGQKVAVLYPMSPWKIAEPQRRTGKLTRELQGVTTNGVVVTPTEKNRWVRESWYAPDLHLAMLTVIEDPEEGRKVYTFEDVNLGEPDKGLFKAPKHVKVIDARAAQTQATIYVGSAWPYLPGRVWVRVPIAARRVTAAGSARPHK